jgi:hypothetical protein
MPIGAALCRLVQKVTVEAKAVFHLLNQNLLKPDLNRSQESSQEKSGICLPKEKLMENPSSQELSLGRCGTCPQMERHMKDLAHDGKYLRRYCRTGISSASLIQAFASPA